MRFDLFVKNTAKNAAKNTAKNSFSRGLKKLGLGTSCFGQGSQQARLTVVTLLCCFIPYLGLRLYLWRTMHGTEDVVSAPSGALLATMLVLGSAVPALTLGFVLRALIQDRNHFQLGSLLQIYGLLIVIFASGYAILQSSSLEPSFSGMPVLWQASDVADLGTHVRRLHEVFLNALYLSVITISTVGYGDLVPLSAGAKVLSALEGLVGIGFMGVALGHYFSVRLNCK